MPVIKLHNDVFFIYLYFVNYHSTLSTSLRCRWQTRATQCCTQMSTVSVINWWPRPSPVYHTDRPSKLTAPEIISRSRDMVGAYRNLNGSRDMTTPF